MAVGINHSSRDSKDPLFLGRAHAYEALPGGGPAVSAAILARNARTLT
jgi:hypothetical protein